jgi:hypothetical protein
MSRFGVMVFIVFCLFVIGLAVFLQSMSELQYKKSVNSSKTVAVDVQSLELDQVGQLSTTQVVKKQNLPESMPNSYPATMKEFMCDMATQFPDNYDKNIYCK